MDIEKRLFDFITNFDPFHEGYTETEADQSELLRLIEVGASCFNHYCVGYDDT